MKVTLLIFLFWNIVQAGFEPVIFLPLPFSILGL